MKDDFIIGCYSISLKTTLYCTHAISMIFPSQLFKFFIDFNIGVPFDSNMLVFMLLLKTSEYSEVSQKVIPTRSINTPIRPTITVVFFSFLSKK